MGSELSKSYSVGDHHVASAGCAGLWRIYPGTRRAGGDPVSVWVFDKREDLKQLQDKAHREVLMDIQRRDLKCLQLMNHPAMIEVIEAFDDGKGDKIAFVTEPVKCSLAQALAVPGRLEVYEKARGLYSVAEGLGFLHHIARRMHLNVAPESVVITPGGRWKLAGMGFSLEAAAGDEQVPCPHFMAAGSRGISDGPWRLHPVLSFSSLEATAPPGSGGVSPRSDLFALGALMFEVLTGASLLGSSDSLDAHRINASMAQTRMSGSANALPPSALQLMLGLVNAQPLSRPPLQNVISNPIFHQPEVMALRSVDSIPHKPPAEAASILGGIRQQVAAFPSRIQHESVLYNLLSSAKNYQEGRLWGAVLPLVSDVLRLMNSAELSEQGIQSKLIPAMQREEPEALLELMRMMDLVLEKFSSSRAFMEEHVVPMVCRALAKEGQSALQEAALKVAGETKFNAAVGPAKIEEDLLPRTCWLVVKSCELSIRVHALMCVAKTFQYLPTSAVITKVIPTLKFATERDSAVAVQLCCLGCYEAIAKSLDKKHHIATSILPSVAPILVNKELNPPQFEMVASKVQALLDMAVTSQRAIVEANPDGRRDPAPVVESSGSADGKRSAATASAVVSQQASSFATRLTGLFKPSTTKTSPKSSPALAAPKSSYSSSTPGSRAASQPLNASALQPSNSSSSSGLPQQSGYTPPKVPSTAAGSIAGSSLGMGQPSGPLFSSLEKQFQEASLQRGGGAAAVVPAQPQVASASWNPTPAQHPHSTFDPFKPSGTQPPPPPPSYLQPSAGQQQHGVPLSVEDQLRETQREIAMLQAQLQPAAQLPGFAMPRPMGGGGMLQFSPTNNGMAPALPPPPSEPDDPFAFLQM
jgi:SCY1-like protein 2